MNSTGASTIEQSKTETACHSVQEHLSEHRWLPEEPGATQPVPATDHGVPNRPKKSSVERRRLTVSLPLELLERSRNTVYWTKGLTLARLLEQALTHSLDHRERLNGQPFPKRLEDLKGGRPPNSDR